MCDFSVLSLSGSSICNSLFSYMVSVYFCKCPLVYAVGCSDSNVVTDVALRFY